MTVPGNQRTREIRVTTQVGEAEIDNDEQVDAPHGVERVWPWVLFIGGIVGAGCAIILTIEKIHTLQDPNYVPSCNFNPLISCGSVMNTPQGSVFGFANPIIGIFGFAVVITIGVARLTKIEFPDWFWMGLLFGELFGLGFIHWLFFESVYVIQKLCPYCMAVWLTMITIFCYTILALFSSDRMGAPESVRRPLRAAARLHWVYPIVWYAVILVCIIVKFWSFWPTMF